MGEVGGAGPVQLRDHVLRREPPGGWGEGCLRLRGKEADFTLILVDQKEDLAGEGRLNQLFFTLWNDP